MRAVARGLVLATLVGVLLQPPHGSSWDDAPPPTEQVLQLEGRGFFDKALCLGCAAAIVAGGELTWGGIFLLASRNPDVIGACVYQCYRAFAS